MGRSVVCTRRGSHSYPNGCAAVLVVAVLMAAAIHPVAAEDAGPKSEEETNPSWVLAHHSFERTLTYDDRLVDWLTSASTMALRDRVQVLPPVPDRYGLFWHKKALSTKNFEVTFNMNAIPQNKGGKEDGVLALWLSPDNFAEAYNEQAIVTVRNWGQGLTDANLTFFSNKPNFKGLGVFFLGADKEGKLRPSVTAMICDGSKKIEQSDLPAAQDGQAGVHQTKYIDWRQKKVEVKVKAKLGGLIVGTVKVADQPPVEVFRFSAEDSKDTAAWVSTFMGFSGWTGTSSALELDMNRLEMRNFDTEKIGEEMKDEQGLADDLGDAEGWKQVLEAEKHFIDQKGQKEAVERLSKLLGDYVDRYNKMGQKVQSDLLWLDKRMATLDHEVNNVITGSRAVNPETGGVEASALKDHIVGIRAAIMKDKDVHDQKLHKVSSAATKLKEKGGDTLGQDGRAKVASVAEQVASVEIAVTSGSTQTTSLLMVLILAVVALGLLFLNRMRYYEKKHYI